MGKVGMAKQGDGRSTAAAAAEAGVSNQCGETMLRTDGETEQQTLGSEAQMQPMDRETKLVEKLGDGKNHS